MCTLSWPASYQPCVTLPDRIMVKRPHEDVLDDTDTIFTENEYYANHSAEEWWKQTWGLFRDAESPESIESTDSHLTDGFLTDCPPAAATLMPGNEGPAKAADLVSGEIAEFLDSGIFAQDTAANDSLRTQASLKSLTSAKEGIICFGMIHEVPTRLKCDLTWLREYLLSKCNGKAHVGWTVLDGSDCLGLALCGSDTTIAQLCKDVSPSARDLLGTDTVVLEVLMDVQACLARIERCSRSIDAITQVDINVYGTRSVCDTVGDLLSRRKVYLQHPKCLASSSSYENPHMVKFVEIGQNKETDTQPNLKTSLAKVATKLHSLSMIYS